MTHLLLACFLLAQTQQPKYLLGDIYPSPEIITPSGIHLQTNGFDIPRRKKERKSENWLRERGVAEEVIWRPADYPYQDSDPDFRRYTERLWSSPDQLVEWTERAATFLPANIDPRTITVIVVPTIFWVQEAQQWRMTWAVGRTVYAAIVWVTTQYDGVHAQVRTLRNDLAWAFANQVR